MAFALPLAAVASAVASVAGAGISAIGSIEQGKAASQAATYNADVAKQNEQIATQDAVRAGQAGEAQVGIQQQKTRAESGAVKTSEAASGVDVNTGSAADVLASTSAVGQLNALSVRQQAATQAYGYQTEGVSFQDQANLDTAQAANASTAGGIGAAGTLLGGLGNTGSNYARYLSQNSPINTGDGSTGAIGGTYGLGIAG